MDSPFLKVIGQHTAIAEQISFDGYLPLQADFGDNVGGTGIYWYLRPGKSILKITANGESGQVMAVDCVGLEKTRIIEDSNIVTCESVEPGLPVVDTLLWEHGIDEFHFRTAEALSVSVNVDAIQFRFGDDCPLMRELQSGNVFFGIDESRYLRSVRFVGLNADQIEDFLSACE